MKINKNNFIRFQDAADDTSIIPNPYLIENKQCGYMPLLVPGETTSFFVNIKGGFDYGDFNQMQLNLVSVSGASTPVSGLQKLTVRDSLYNVYASFVTPTNLNDGVYSLELISANGTFVSNPLRIIREDYKDKSVVVSYRNNREVFGFNYDELQDYYNRFRLHIFNVGEEFEYNNEQYRSVSSGKLRDFNGSIDKFIKLETYYFDKGAHNACAAILFHSDIQINGKKYTVKTAYQYNPPIQTLTSKGTFELWDEEYSRLNKC